MNKYKVTHKANARHVWEEEEIEAAWAQVSDTGVLSFGLPKPDAVDARRFTAAGFIAAGWWMRCERSEPPKHGDPGHRCRDGCPVD